MRNKVLAVCIICLCSVYGCKKEFVEEVRKYAYNVEISSGTDYYLELEPFMEDSTFALITRPSIHHLKSELLYPNGSHAPVYHYISVAPPGTKDEVIVKIVKEHEHLPGEHDEENHAANDNYIRSVINIHILVK